MTCGARSLLVAGQRCRDLGPEACSVHFLQYGALSKPCVRTTNSRGERTCIAGRARDCSPVAANRTGALCSTQGLLDVSLLREPPWLCRRLAREDCAFFYIRLPRPLQRASLAPGTPRGRERPCEWRRGACAAAERDACLALSRRGGPRLHGAGGGAVREAREALPKLAARRARRAARTDASRLGLPCTSARAAEGGDKRRTDCEDWCEVRNGSLAHCKLCKCRACKACYATPLPRWATANPTAVRATCALFGASICNSTGNFSATLEAVTARWNYNHTQQWIDDIFSAYQKGEGAARPFVPLTVAAESGLTEQEVKAMEAEAAAGGAGRL